MRNIRQLCVAFLMTMVTACGGGGTIGSSNTGGGTPTTTVTLPLWQDSCHYLKFNQLGVKA